MNNNRAKVFLIALNIMLVYFIFRLYNLQIADHAKYSKLAFENAARTSPILAPRGIIQDRFGNVLIKNKPVFKVYILPNLLPSDRTPVFNELADVLNVPQQEIEARYKENKNPIFEGILIANDVSPVVVSKIEELHLNLKGIETICYPVRQYPYKSCAAHVLGYVREIEKEELAGMKNRGYRLGDLIGKDGVEKYYDEYIRGKSGGKKIEVDAYGRPVKILEVLDPIPGNNVTLTIDNELQEAAEAALGHNSGAVVVLDPNSGQILALVSHPSYDASEKWTKMEYANHPFMNRALSPYPPGSTFKVVTMTAGVLEGKTTIDERFYCPGYYRLGKRIAKCWLESGHGSLSLFEGLVNSCDIVFYEVGRRLGPDVLNYYALKFGLGKKTGIDLPQEKKGFIPSALWKKEKLGVGWYVGDSINMGIGQGFIQVTPLQMACLYGEIAVGRRFRPYILKSVIDNQGKIIFKNEDEVVDALPVPKDYFDSLRAALKAIVVRGTGRGAKVPGMQASGKTGTAENPGLPHAWFVCYAPSDNPKIVISAFIEHGQHGDQGTAKIARDILTWYRDHRMPSKEAGIVI